VLADLEDWIWDRKRLPVPIDQIADDHFGLLVRERSPEEMASAPGAPELDSGQSLSGLLLAGPGEIWVNAAEAREWPPRRRFTIAHELGHWVMHRREGQQSLFCRHGSVEPSERDESPPEQLTHEDEANIFAAALLMPADLMRRHYERHRHHPDCHARMCDLFAASDTAMGRRMHAVI
jgi:hypothetical protein